MRDISDLVNSTKSPKVFLPPTSKSFFRISLIFLLSIIFFISVSNSSSATFYESFNTCSYALWVIDFGSFSCSSVNSVDGTNYSQAGSSSMMHHNTSETIQAMKFDFKASNSANSSSTGHFAQMCFLNVVIGGACKGIKITYYGWYTARVTLEGMTGYTTTDINLTFWYTYTMSIVNDNIEITISYANGTIYNTQSISKSTYVASQTMVVYTTGYASSLDNIYVYSQSLSTTGSIQIFTSPDMITTASYVSNNSQLYIKTTINNNYPSNTYWFIMHRPDGTDQLMDISSYPNPLTINIIPNQLGQWEFLLMECSSTCIYLDIQDIMVLSSAGVWSVTATRSGDQYVFSACAGDTLGYFYTISPDNNTHYATYIDAKKCSEFNIPISDMIATGGTGVWNAAIFDASDLSQSKAFAQFYISEHILINFISVPTNANVTVNGIYIGQTPIYGWNTNNTFDLNIVISYPGYLDYVLKARYSSSTNITAILVQGIPGVNGFGTIANDNLRNISSSIDSISSNLQNYNYTGYKNILAYFIPDILNTIPSKVYAVWILGWIFLIILLVMKR